MTNKGKKEITGDKEVTQGTGKKLRATKQMDKEIRKRKRKKKKEQREGRREGKENKKREKKYSEE